MGQVPEYSAYNKIIMFTYELEQWQWKLWRASQEQNGFHLHKNLAFVRLCCRDTRFQHHSIEFPFSLSGDFNKLPLSRIARYGRAFGQQFCYEFTYEMELSNRSTQILKEMHTYAIEFSNGNAMGETIQLIAGTQQWINQWNEVYILMRKLEAY